MRTAWTWYRENLVAITEPRWAFLLSVLAAPLYVVCLVLFVMGEWKWGLGVAAAISISHEILRWIARWAVRRAAGSGASAG
jgi:hypothetical protein